MNKETVTTSERVNGLSHGGICQSFQHGSVINSQADASKGTAAVGRGAPCTMRGLALPHSPLSNHTQYPGMRVGCGASTSTMSGTHFFLLACHSSSAELRNCHSVPDKCKCLQITVHISTDVYRTSSIYQCRGLLSAKKCCICRPMLEKILPLSIFTKYATNVSIRPT